MNPYWADASPTGADIVGVNGRGASSPPWRKQQWQTLNHKGAIMRRQGLCTIGMVVSSPDTQDSDDAESTNPKRIRQ